MSNPTYNPAPGPYPTAPPPPKKKRTGLIVFLAITAVVLVAIIGGCSAFVASMGKAIEEAGPNDIAATTGSDTGAGPADESGDGAAEDDKTAKIGATVRYEDGTEISVRKAEMVPAGDFSSAADGNLLVVTVRITNNGSEKFDAALALVNVSYGKDGEQADSGYADDTDFGFEGDIAPGKSKTAKFGFEVTKKQAKDLQITVTPGFIDYGDAIFTGSAS